MDSYNSFERTISKILANFPIVKKFSKSFYMRLVYMWHRKNISYKSFCNINSLPSKSESFFGYYDKSPSNIDGCVLAHISKFGTSTIPEIDKSIEVALFSKDMAKMVWSKNTAAYNWQQGARLQWLDDEFFIYNDYDLKEKSYVAKVVSAKTFLEVKSFLLPVQDSFATNYFLSLNYRRLMTLHPEYGYHNLPNMSEAELEDMDNDGIWRVDYDTGQALLLVTLTQIYKLKQKPEFTNALHMVNHAMISPNGSKFIFLHRYLIGQRRFDRLILADSTTGELKLLSDYGMVSHCFWVDHETILAYMCGPENKDAYWLVNIVSNSMTHFIALENFGDGHPHVCGDWFVVDTYPDKSRMQHLNLVNWKQHQVIKLGEFFHGFEYNNQTRCDLHPRFSYCGKKVYFDSVFSGRRKLYEMELGS